MRPSLGTRRLGYAADLGQARREIFLQMGLDSQFTDVPDEAGREILVSGLEWVGVGGLRAVTRYVSRMPPERAECSAGRLQEHNRELRTSLLPCRRQSGRNRGY